MTFERMDRLNELLKKQVSYLIQHRLKDPRIGFVSITDVETSGDLSQSKIFVSVLGTEQEKEQTLQALQNASGFIRSVVAEKNRLRHTPKILFRLDNSIERGTRILKLLKDVRDERDPDG